LVHSTSHGRHKGVEIYDTFQDKMGSKVLVVERSRAGVSDVGFLLSSGGQDLGVPAENEFNLLR